MTFVKFCGCMNPSDVEASVEAGADAVGLVFAPSPRRVDERMASEIARNFPPGIKPIAVFANPDYEQIAFVRSIFDDPYVQLSGRESPGFVSWVGPRAIKTLHVEVKGEPEDRIVKRGKRFGSALLLLDTRARKMLGGTGKPFAWWSVKALARERPIIVAGGLTPENVASCVREVRPFGVDVRSGIETNGRKDPHRMREFVRAVRDADAR